MTMCDEDKLFDHIMDNARYAKKMVNGIGSKKGKRLIICGAGPSLRQYVTEPVRWHAHEVWACNSALTYLHDHDVRVTHAFGIDQSLGMLDDWQRTFDVEYLVASSIQPKLRDHLLSAGRKLRWFHNYLGLPDPPDWKPPADWVRPLPQLGYELFLYQTLFQDSIQTQYGLNAVARALCLGATLGFSKIRIYGSDCAGVMKPLPPHLAAYLDTPSGQPLAGTPDYAEFMDHLVMYADGRTALDVYGPLGTIVRSPKMEGRFWFTRADMAITAQHLVDLINWYPEGRIELVGDTLPGMLKRMGPEFFAGTSTMPRIDGKGNVVGFTATPEQEEMYKAFGVTP
jgi:hypothetical protein